MSFAVAAENLEETIEMRKAYVETVLSLAQNDERIVVLEADLMSAIATTPFQKQYPNRLVNCGIMEANMVSVAAGLSLAGKIPYIHSFCPFITRRSYDQLFVSGAYSGSNIRIIGSEPGIMAEFNGGTHTSFEDIGLMRNIPGTTVIDATDSTMLRNILTQLNDQHGMYYIRMIRKKAAKIYQDGSTFTIGKGNLLRDGNDVTIIAIGIMVEEALAAAQMLAAEGIHARVIDMFTVKPIDTELVVKAAQDTGAIVTAENHSIINGLGSAVAEVLCELHPVPLKRIGVRDRFGQVGVKDYLLKQYGLTREDIYSACKEVMQKAKR